MYADKKKKPVRQWKTKDFVLQEMKKEMYI